MTAATKPDGRLVENILHFTQALRKAGREVGTAQVETAIEAVEAAGFTKRVDFYHILRATLITRAEHLEVFHQVFSMFWRDPDFLRADADAVPAASDRTRPAKARCRATPRGGGPVGRPAAPRSPHAR
jgi:uncharacterized protein with von Willebrand factor type A (vWA) domain